MKIVIARYNVGELHVSNIITFVNFFVILLVMDSKQEDNFKTDLGEGGLVDVSVIQIGINSSDTE
jgi:hypothetical protein